MLVTKVYFIMLSIFTPKCYNVEVEYYDDKSFDNDSRKIILVDEYNARRTIELKDSEENVTRSIMIMSNSMKINDNEDAIILSYQVETPKIRLHHIATKVDNVNDSLNYKNITKPTLKSDRVTIKTTLDLSALEEYDEDKDTSNILRNQPSLDVTNNLNNSSVKYDMSLDKMMYSRFFSLDPAVDLEAHRYIGDYKVDKNVWYVPQEFPCWELPILYGVQGSTIRKSAVFLIYGGSLVDVVDPWTKTNSTFKTVDQPLSQTTNKWCEVEPCYGDHTLCLFANKDISNICDKNYVIHVPSIMDQYTIINTINAMRNRIANGLTDKYSHLPTAANMKQVTYDYDLEKIAEAWLRQCLPGSAPCSALDGNIVAQLECTKYMKYCCLKKSKTKSRCVPKSVCFIHPVIGCLHVWFSSAGKKLIETDINCGRTTVSTFNTVQLLWAKTNKMGCAYGESGNGDIRVVCNFSPGAPFHLETNFFCGIIAHHDVKSLRNNNTIMEPNFLKPLGIIWTNELKMSRMNLSEFNKPSQVPRNYFVTTPRSKSLWGVDSLTKVYNEHWLRRLFANRENGTRGMVARLVARYIFVDETEARCDSDESVYIAGPPGSLCVEKSRTFHALCYDYRDPTPGYRLIAILAPIALFSLILYDLFSGVVRQTNY